MLRHLMVVMVVVVVVVEVQPVEGVATPLRPPIRGYAGVSADSQTVLVDPSLPPPQPRPPATSLPHSKKTPTSLPHPKSPSSMVPSPQPPSNTSLTPPAHTGVTGSSSDDQAPQAARLTGGRYPLQRLRQQRWGGKGEWRRRSGGALMGGRRLRPSGTRRGVPGSGRRRYLTGARRRAGQGKAPALHHLQHRFALSPAVPVDKDDDFLSRWHSTYSGNHQRPPAAAATTALPSSSLAAKSPQPQTPPTLASVPPAVAASVHDMTSRHYTADNTTTTNATTTNSTTTTTTMPPGRPASGRRPPSRSLVSSTSSPSSTSTPPLRADPQTAPRGTDILGSVQSIVRAATGDEQRLAAAKTVGNAAPPPLDVFAGVPAAAGFVPSAHLDAVLQTRPPSPPATPTTAPRAEPRPASAIPAALQPQGLTTGHYLVAVGLPVPPEVRDGGLVLSGDGDVVVGRPAGHIQAPQQAASRAPPPRPAEHTTSAVNTHRENHIHVTTSNPAHSPTISPAPNPAHTLSSTSLHRSDPDPAPAHVLTQLPGPQKVVLGPVAPWTPEEVRPLLAFIRRKYGEAVTSVPASVTSLQALINSGRVPEVFHGPQVLDGLKTTTAAAAPLYRPVMLKRRKGEAWHGEVAVRKSQEAVRVSRGGRFVALSSLALLMAFCGYLIFASDSEKVSQPRGATGMLMTAVEEAKKGLNLLLQDLDEYEEHLRARKEEEENEIVPQRIKKEKQDEQKAGQEGGLMKDISNILTKMWDVVVPPEVRGPNSVISHLSSGLGFNTSRTSKRLSVFLQPAQHILPSLTDLKETGIKFMNRITENGAEVLIQSVRDKGFDLIQVNGTDAAHNGSSVLTMDRVSSAIHSFLGSLNTEPVTRFISSLANPFNPFRTTTNLTLRGDETQKQNQAEEPEPYQEPENNTKTINTNQEQEDNEKNEEKENMNDRKEIEEDKEEEDGIDKKNNSEEEKREEENDDEEKNQKDEEGEEREEEKINSDNKITEGSEDEDEVVDEKIQREEDEEEQTNESKNEYKKIIESIEEKENGEQDNRIKEEETIDKEEEKENSEEKEEMTNTEESNNSKWKKGERKEGKGEKEEKIHQDKEERELKVILNNLLHVGHLPPPPSSLSSSSSSSSSFSFSSSFPSRIDAYLNNIPLSQVTQKLHDT